MSSKDCRESRLGFSDSLNGQRWIFLKKGLDDFRDGYPPSPANVVVYGRKRLISVNLQSSTPTSSSAARREKRKQPAKTQVCLSKLSLLQRAGRDYVARIERGLNQHPVVLCPCSEKTLSPKVLREDAGVLDPEMLLKSKAGDSVCEENAQSKVKALKTQVHGEESGRKTPCTRLSKKEAVGREKEATLTDPVPPGEHVKRATKHFCDWVMSLGGGNCNMDKDTLVSLLSTSCEREAAVPSPFHAAKFKGAEAERSKTQEIAPPQSAVRSSHGLRSLPCQVKVSSQAKWEKIRYGAWYLDPTTWRKQKVNEPLKVPEAAVNTLGNGKDGSEKEMEVAQPHSAQAFKEFLERKGYRKPRFLLKMLAGGNDSRAPEETSKARKKVSEEI